MSNFLTSVTHRHFDSTDSTNTQLINAVVSDVLPHDAHHLYTADYQTAGRGQHGRTWISGADNVFLSLYIPLGQDDYKLNKLSGLLSLTVGYHLTELEIIKDINQNRVLNHLAPIGVKWANDVGFYDETLNSFQKLAGILIEPVFKKLNASTPTNALIGVVIGIGLNVANSPQIKDGLYQAICLKELSNRRITAQNLYAPMTNQIIKAVKNCNRCHEPIYLQNFLDNFNTRHLLTDKYVHIFIQNDMTNIYAKGKCIGIGNQGELLIKHNDAVKSIFAGMAKIIPHEKEVL